MIAVTGGAGAMGTRLVRCLRRNGHAVRVVDLAGRRGEGDQFHGADITDPDSLDGAFEGCTAVIHLAGLVLALGRADRLDRTNRIGTENVVRLAKDAGVHRLVHVSSISVCYSRSNAYSRSKAAAEAAVAASGLDWTILRPCLAFGDPTCAEHEAFLRRAARGGILPLPRGGAALKSPVHVDDLAEAFAACLEAPASRGRILALGGSRTLSLAQMAREIATSNGRNLTIIPLPAGPAALLARFLPPLLRRLGFEPPGDWQTFTGLVEDAAPDPKPALQHLRWRGRPWSAP